MLRLRIHVERFLSAFARLIYPAACLFCERSLRLREAHVCAHCKAAMPILQKPVCSKCAMEIPPYLPKSARCSSCRSLKTYFRSGSSVFPYGEKMKLIFKQVKFKKKPWYLKGLLRRMGTVQLPLAPHQYDLIIPVPIDRQRLRERGFNQSGIIARILQKKLAPRQFNFDGFAALWASSIKSNGFKVDTPLAKPKLVNALKKIKSTPRQSELERSHRMKNLSDAFCVKRNALWKIRNKTILLVDDIATTLSTVNECAKCLTLGGARRVDFFSIARTIVS